MRIVHTEASCGWGGQEIRILNEARGMILRGHAVQLLCPAEARIHAEAPRFGVPVTSLPIGRKTIGGVLAMRRWLKANPVDVINTHSSTDTWLTALACASIGSAPPLVRTRHISAPVPNNLSTRWLYGTASRMIVTTGASLRQALIDDNGLDPARVVSIPTGIDTTLYRPPFAAERQASRRMIGVEVEAADEFVVGIVATLRSWKGHRYLIEAVAQLQARKPAFQLKLVIVGDGPQRATLEQQVTELELGETVRFAGNQSDVVPWLHGFDAFALPSYANEGVPQALLQAMACALPVITTDAGAIGEIARDQETALIVARQNRAPLADAILRLAADPKLREHLAGNASQLVHSSHGLDTMLERMEAVFRLVSAP
jgi:glycosyltransferase involved in cell wall biosynthesis